MFVLFAQKKKGGVSLNEQVLNVRDLGLTHPCHSAGSLVPYCLVLYLVSRTPPLEGLWGDKLVPVVELSVPGADSPSLGGISPSFGGNSLGPDTNY